MRRTLLRLGNYLAWNLPTSFFRPFSLPFAFQTRVADGFMYENGHMINIAFGYCSNNKIQGIMLNLECLRVKQQSKLGKPHIVTD